MLATAWIVAASVSVVISEDTNLLLVQMLFRHGARAPVTLYPTDPYPPEIWPEGLGTLTQLGKRQHYVLGKFLRFFYSGFVTSNPNEILVNSTEYDRCQRSALSTLASFYAPSKEWEVEDGLHWQPVVVNYKDGASDKYLSLHNDCPKFIKVRKQGYSSSDLISEMEKHQDMLEALKLYGNISTDWQSVFYLHDTVYSEKQHGLVVPEWLEPYWTELTELTDFLFSRLYNTTVEQKLGVGPLFEKMIENMDNKIAGKNDQLKVHMYSAHDANIAGVLQALDLYEHRPPFSACLLIELHEMLDGKAVRLLYLNSSTPENFSTIRPHLLQLHGCGEFCPLEDFRELTRPIIPEDWAKECHATDEGQ